jgi:phosphoesterase RecJ-like protein
MKERISQILNLLEKENHFLITSHIRPDGDAVASQLALAHLLKGLGKGYRIINEEPPPSLYSFLPLSDEISLLSEEMGPFRVAIVLDCHETSRLANGLDAIVRRSSSVVIVDHHPGESEFEGFSLIVPRASSTCEVLYGLIRSSKIGLDYDIATCLYTGIFTDTGGFSYDNTGSRTHAIAAHLLKYGIDVEGIWCLLNRVENPNFIILTSLVLGTLKVEGERVAHITLTKEMEKRCGFENIGLEADILLRHIRPLRGVKVSILFRELGDARIKVSMRTSSTIDMDKIARRFGGGGHPQAAGCILYTSLEDAKEKIVKEIERWIR